MSEPPLASSWAAPPEFYLDENSVTRSVRRFLNDLGYVVYTPGSVFGACEEAYGADGTEWLRRIAGSGWVVIGRDSKIAIRPYELGAYHKANVHMFLLPGEATKRELVELLAVSLKSICTTAVTKPVGIWRIRASGLTAVTGTGTGRKSRKSRRDGTHS